MATASNPMFERSISLNDLDTSSKVRELILQDVSGPEDERNHCQMKSYSKHSFVLKSFKNYHSDFKKFLYSYVVDFGIFRDLEASGKLNWCEGLFPMVPVLTIGDGNCLMHAASIGMWAVNDRSHVLRKLVHNALLEDTRGLYHKRWQREHEVVNMRPLHGYKMTDDQWAREWQIVLQLVSNEEYPVGSGGMQYGSLEEIHIFILANVLRRTIVVISNDTLRGSYDESLSPVNIAGIYLPLNSDPIDCIKTPLVIGFAQGHFTAIVSFEDGIFDQGEIQDADGKTKIHGVPLEKSDGTALPVHFLLEDEEVLRDGLLRQYLDCTKVTHKNLLDDSKVVTMVARLLFVPQLDCVSFLVDKFFSCAAETYQQMLEQKSTLSGSETPSLHLEECRTKDCEFFGTQETLFLCSKCLEQYLETQTAPVTPSAPSLASSEVFPNVRGSGPTNVFTQQQQLIPQQNQTLASKKCSTNGCKYNVTGISGNLCLRCYDSEMQAEEQAKSIRYYNIDATKCANSVNGCLFYGSLQQEGLCSRCYLRFCLEMELRSEKPTMIQGRTVQMSAQGLPCQTTGCPGSGLKPLYGRCIACYSDCIRTFITSDESKSLQTFARTQTPTQITEAKLCVFRGCQNTGKGELDGLCKDCFTITRKGTERVTMTTKEPERNVLLNVTEQHSNKEMAGFSPGSAGVSGVHANNIFCETLKCHNPVGECIGTLCPQCIMDKCQMTKETSSQQTQHLAGRQTELEEDQKLEYPNAWSTSHAQSGAKVASKARASLPKLFIPPSTTSGAAKPKDISLDTSDLKRCVTGNCQFYGDSKTSFLCSKCYEESKEEWKKVADMTQRLKTWQTKQGHIEEPFFHPLEPVRPKATKPKGCAFGEFCYNPGNPAKGGLCDKCYQVGFRNEKEWEAINRHRYPTSEPQRPQPIRAQPPARAQPPVSSAKPAKKSFVDAGAPCKTPGCLKFGTMAKNGLCEPCFEKHQQEQARASPTTGLVSPVVLPNYTVAMAQPKMAPLDDRSHMTTVLAAPTFSTQAPIPAPRMLKPTGRSSRCKQQGCRMSGGIEYGGYCYRCYIDNSMQYSSYPESVPDLHTSPVSDVTFLQDEDTILHNTPRPFYQQETGRTLNTIQRVCAMPKCSNLVQPCTMSHCRECREKLNPEGSKNL